MEHDINTIEPVDDPTLNALLSEALSARAQDVEAVGLTQRIHEATAQHFAAPRDATLDPMLHAAVGVASADVPDDLPDRVYEATADLLPGQAVLARIGWRRWAMAAALAIVSTGIWFTAGAKLQHEQRLAALEENLTQATQVTTIAAVHEPITTDIDLRIDNVREEADRLQSSLATTEWQHAWSDLDAALRDELNPGL